MGANESRLGMATQHLVSRFVQFAARRKAATAERPVRMRVQFFPALVETVGRKKECVRIGNVYSDRHTEVPRRFPHGIESRVVDTHQLARAISQTQAEHLQYFQSARPGPVRALDLIGLE